MPKPPRVFISYAREDYPVANRVYQDLKSLGAEPWLDRESLLPGQKWGTEIQKAIRTADYFIALLSNTSLGKRGYVQKEFREAKEVLDEIPEGKIFFLPARVEDCQPEDPRINELNWVDLFPSYPAGIDRILRVIRPPKWKPSDIQRPTELDSKTDLSSQGWGVIFPENSDPAIRQALAPLLNYRREQASARDEKLYREFAGEQAYRMGSDHLQFLRSNGTDTGSPDPSKMPGYLLIVGSPDEIPFQLQYGLGLQRQIGRIHFDTVDEYRRYAQNVIQAEALATAGGSSVSFFCPTHPGDTATRLSERLLVQPLFDSVRRAFPKHMFTKYAAEQATKRALIKVFSQERPQRPDFLFVLAHGMAFRPGEERQILEQGSILCADWPGAGAVSREHYLTADDLPASANLVGLQLFFFSEYGAGTPSTDDFGDPDGTPKIVAPKPFVSGLAKRLLGRENGASAIIAHVDRCWTLSFARSDGSEIQTFLNVMSSILSGKPVGLAHRYLYGLYGEFAALLLEQFRSQPGAVHSAAFRKMTTATLDARNYVVLGDPAARCASS
jgi:hypothetical protein